MTSYMSPPLNLRGLSGLLESNYFDPVLWSLYYTCSQLYKKKPRDLGKREIRIRNYRDSNVYKLNEELKQIVIEEKLLWLKGDSTALRDILIYDKAKPLYALMGVVKPPHIADADDNDDNDTDKGHKTFYIIPAEWLPYVYIRRYENDEWLMYLSKNKFCCRQVLVRGSVTVARRENISIDERYCRAENYFHVGVGKCKAEIHDVLADVGIFINGRQLYERTKSIAEPYGKVREVIYTLSVREKIIKFGDEDLISGKFLRGIMKHLLVCRLCNIYVDKLIKMICDVLVQYEFLGNLETNNTADMTIDGGVPCFSYILDGDFVHMRGDAFNAPLKTLSKDKRKGVQNICREIILPFFEKYNNVNICPHTSIKGV